MEEGAMRPRSSMAQTRCFVWSFVLSVLALGLASPARAQQAVQHPAAHAPDVRGSLAGTVRNANATAAVGVTVAATNAETTARFTATTDAQGAYNFAALPVGKYDLTVEAVGLTMYRQAGIEVAADRAATANIAMTASGASQLGDNERQALMERIATLEQRITDLESTAVLSEPETRVRRVEVFVDANGTVYEEPVAGATPQVTYERERVYRRQRINEKLEEAIEDAA